MLEVANWYLEPESCHLKFTSFNQLVKCWNLSSGSWYSEVLKSTSCYAQFTSCKLQAKICIVQVTLIMSILLIEQCLLDTNAGKQQP